MKSGKEKGRRIRVVDGMFADGYGGFGHGGGKTYDKVICIKCFACI